MRWKAFVDWTIRELRMKPKSVEQLMLPMMISGWVAGRGIIEFPLGKRWPVASCIYSLMLLSGFSIAVKLTLEWMETNGGSPYTITMFIFRGNLYLFVCIDICNTLLGWTSIRSVKMIIYRLEASGKKMEELGIPQDYKFLYWRQSITLLAEIFYVMCAIVLLYDWDWDTDELWIKIRLVIATHHPLILLSTGDAAFVTLVRALNLKFEQLNRVLKQLSTTTDNSPQHKRMLELAILKRHNVVCGFKKQTNDDPKLMRMALENHYELVRIGSLINETFGPQALLSIASMFYFLFALLWYIFGLSSWGDWDENSLSFVLTALSWVPFGGFKIFNMTSACAKASNECRETAVIICHLHESSTGKTFRDGVSYAWIFPTLMTSRSLINNLMIILAFFQKISDFLLQMTQHSVKFTACGLFTLDHSLFHGIVAAVTMYFVIAGQLGNPNGV